MLQPEQQSDIEKYADANPFPLKEQILNRNHLSDEFLKVFPDKNKRKKFIHQLFYQYDSLREASYAKAIDEGKHKYYEIIANILNKMTTDQKKILSRKLIDRSEQVRKTASKTKTQLF